MSRKVYILNSPWLRAAAEFRRAKDFLVPDALVCGARILNYFRWSAEYALDFTVRHEAQFIWGADGEYGRALFGDMDGRWLGPSALESAARVAESLAYDNTDGPADEVT